MEILINRSPINLYKQSASGAIQIWSIWADDDNVIFIEWGQEGGELQVQYEEIEEGKAARTVEEQVLSRINSRIEKKLDQGYVNDKAEAKANKPTNRMGLSKPMLAKSYSKVKDIDHSTSWIQPKYDGHRCLINRSGSEYVAYSRNGKLIDTIPEIMEEIHKLDMPNGSTLDGELYLHRTPLQRITSLVKRRQEDTEKLTYMVYDIIMDGSYNTRLEALVSILHGHQTTKLQLVSTIPCPSASEIPVMLKTVIESGYEGLILRRSGFPYHDGKRSKSLVKIKSFIDDEFLVTDVNPSREGYAILTCITKGGKQFSATAPGTMAEKQKVMDNKLEYIGRKIQLKYANLTEDGVPFHPIATIWRNKASE